jgi:CheY-like chemotaxis protein
MCQENFTKDCCNVNYNLIITDIYMGEVDGISAAEEINKLHSRIADNIRSQLIIVAVTA